MTRSTGIGESLPRVSRRQVELIQAGLRVVRVCWMKGRVSLASFAKSITTSSVSIWSRMIAVLLTDPAGEHLRSPHELDKIRKKNRFIVSLSRRFWQNSRLWRI